MKKLFLLLIFSAALLGCEKNEDNKPVQYVDGISNDERKYVEEKINGSALFLIDSLKYGKKPIIYIDAIDKLPLTLNTDKFFEENNKLQKPNGTPTIFENGIKIEYEYLSIIHIIKDEKYLYYRVFVYPNRRCSSYLIYEYQP
ncbi:hypothetical protein FACS189434_09420 [Bacteroidia bacterium]|nr:hypothetical protein FACS189434_09420 [Bacteroidia bacterium]